MVHAILNYTILFSHLVRIVLVTVLSHHLLHTQPNPQFVCVDMTLCFLSSFYSQSD